MLEQETLDGNKLIAFFDTTIKDYPGGDSFYLPQHTTDDFEDWVHVKYLKYHSSWDWLMPVVEKIESLGYRFDIALNEVDLYDTINADFSTTYKSATKKIAVWLACVEFVKWYNLKKNETIKKQ